MRRVVKSRWDTLTVESWSPKFGRIADDYGLSDLNIHRITPPKDAPDGQRIAFIYEIDNEEDLPVVVGRCISRALVNHKVKALESAYTIQIPDCDNFIDCLEDVLDKIEPDITIVSSRAAMRHIGGTGDYARLDPLELINRLHQIKWPSGIYPTIITLPDKDVFARTKEGRLAKESATRIGEWVSAFTTALRGRNLYTADMSKYKHTIIKTLNQFEAFMDKLWQATVVSIDTETDNLYRIKNRLATIQFTVNQDKHHAYVIPIYHPDSPFTAKEVAYILDELRIYFEEGEQSIHIYANAKFDLIQLRRDCKLQWYNHDLWDIQSALFAADENRKFRDVPLIHASAKKDKLQRYALGQLAIEYGTSVYFKTQMGKDNRDRIFATPLKEVAEYGGVDVVLPFQIYEFQLAEFMARGKAYSRCERIVTKQISSMLKAFVEMEINGLPIDSLYLAKEVAKGGAFVEAREKSLDTLYNMPAVIEANKILLERQVGGNMFADQEGDDKDGWVFDINIIQHQQILFFEVLGLEPTGIGANGPSVNKVFKNTYAPLDDSGKLLEDIAVPEVAEFRVYGELKHLYNSFLKAFYEKMYKDEDMRADRCLRSTYLYLTIVSGRTGASKPSLQQVPSRSPLAKAIKRQFITKPNQLYIKSDYIAAEVKNWGISAKEDRLAAAFITTLAKRKEFRLLEHALSDKENEEWKAVFKKLDLHAQNACLFYNLKIDEFVKADNYKPVRQAVKTLVFGTVYGMSAKRLATTLRISEEEAADLIDLLFEKFPDGAGYITDTHEFGREYLVAVSDIGRIRHLWGYLHTDYGVQGAMDRRGPNSKVQSISSDEGCEGNYQTQRLRWELFHKQNLDLHLQICNSVHDSAESISDIMHTPISTYLLEHGFTTCVHNSYLENYGMEFNVGLESEFEIGGSLATVKGWNYRPEDMRKLVDASIKWQQDTLGYKPPSKEIMRKFEHNLEVINDLRCEELRKLPKNGVSTWMALTPKIARKELILV
jgi:DNA polymerase I-like protein with 3'-5' exonuclease and polymerase domains